MSLPPSTWIEKAIRISSVTHSGNEEIVGFLVPLLEEAGLKVAPHKVRENGQTFINLIAFSDSPQSEGLTVFNTHLDTVSPGESAAWTKTGGDPFKATRVRDRIYGLGTADVKLDFLCKIWAAKAARPWKRPIALVGTYGEERGLIGVGKLFDDNKIRPKYAVVGEPSNLELIYAHKGHLICTVSTPIEKPGSEKTTRRVWRGKAAHSSTPALGINALLKGLTEIFKRGEGVLSLNAGTDSNKVPDRCEALLVKSSNHATHLLYQLYQYFEESYRTLKKRRDSRFKPPSSTLSLNQAVTSDGKLSVTFDIRTVPDIALDRLKTKIEKDLTKMGWAIESLSIDAPLKGRRQGSLIDQASKLLKLSGVKKVVKATKASSTEAAIYQMNGAEAFVFGPGISVGNVHRPNEYNLFSQMNVATQFYEHLMSTPIGAV